MATNRGKAEIREILPLQAEHKILGPLNEAVNIGSFLLEIWIESYRTEHAVCHIRYISFVMYLVFKKTQWRGMCVVSLCKSDS